MGLEFTITTDGSALRRISAGLQAIGQAEMNRQIANAVATTGFIRRAQEYPPPSGKKQPFVSSQQRRAFFARLKRGAITVPYRRTYALKQGWAQVGDGFTVANTQPYADLVMGAGGKQAKYHKGTWRTVEEIALAVQAKDAAPLGISAVVQFLKGKGLT